MGETENGISIAVTTSDRPGKRKRATAQAAAMPKAMLTGTTISAVSVVSHIACSVAGSVMLASQRPQPPAKARARMKTSGATTISSVRTTASPISRRRPVRSCARAAE